MGTKIAWVIRSPFSHLRPNKGPPIGKSRNGLSFAFLYRHRNTCRVAWRFHGQKYIAATSLDAIRNPEAKRLLASLNAILASGGDEFAGGAILL